MRGSLEQRLSSDWCMLAEWAAREEQHILPTSTNPCITRAAGTQGVNYYYNVIVITVMGDEWHVVDVPK